MIPYVQSTLLEAHPPMTNLIPAQTLEEEFDEESHISHKNDKKQLRQHTKIKDHFEICSFCYKKCAPFRRSYAPWRQEKKSWMKKILYLNGDSG
jgi:hypothetical protein